MASRTQVLVSVAKEHPREVFLLGVGGPFMAIFSLCTGHWVSGLCTIGLYAVPAGAMRAAPRLPKWQGHAVVLLAIAVMPMLCWLCYLDYKN